MNKEISLNDFNQMIDNYNSAFLCGNGFSMNFDSDFGNIFNCLFAAHREIINSNAEYKIKAGVAFTKKCNENFKAIKKFLKCFSEKELFGVFEDALSFAESIQQNEDLIEELWDKGLINRLTFGISELDLLNQICYVGREKGISYVNIEHWTILIYFYFAIKQIDPFFNFPTGNSFVLAIKNGDKSDIALTNNLIEQVLMNGFCTYYRLLFSIAIFSNGKSLNISLLNNINNLNTSDIKGFLQKFECLLSLNYDHILKNISERKVEHFHGEFVKNQTEYVYGQSLGLNYNGGYVSFSDILIGDYFIFKTQLAEISQQARKYNIMNKKTKRFSDKMAKIIKGNNINTVVIFGMNIENDQHVIRNIMVSLHSADIQKPHIVYCYFNEQERDDFTEQFEAVITFDEELSRYARNIEVNNIKTQDILNAYFYKSEIVEELLN